MKNPMHTKHNSSSFRAPFGAPGGEVEGKLIYGCQEKDVCWWLMEMFVGSEIFFVVRLRVR